MAIGDPDPLAIAVQRAGERALFQRIADLEAQLASALERAETAEAALRPMVKAAATIPPDQTHPDYDQELVDETFGLTWGDLRRAARTVEPRHEEE